MTDEERERHDAYLNAERLRSDPAFQRAVLEIRKRLVSELITADSTDAITNTRLRAEIKAIDALSGEIALTIERGQPRNRPTPV